jgi:hypothetical protein
MIAIWFLLFTHLQMHSEYRAFLLAFKNDKGQIVKTVTSTLDPIQYQDFFIVPAGQTLSYTDTWMCLGPTMDFKNICPSPRAGAGTVSEGQSAETTRSPAQDQGSK